MTQPASPQINIRSRYARVRASALARETGMTVTQVVEEALRAYEPSRAGAPLGGMVRKGPILVRPASGDTVVSAQAVEDALDALRTGQS